MTSIDREDAVNDDFDDIKCGDMVLVAWDSGRVFVERFVD